MKLFYSNTSPYSRKVRIVAREKDIAIEEVAANPFEENAELKTANPLGAVPTFLLDNGEPLYDSPVICAYLDSLKPSPLLIPADETRWKILRAEALCDGILDAAFSSVMEGRRPETEQSSYWLERWAAAINRAVDVVEKDLTAFNGSLTLAQIALGSALGYLDFRLPHLKWQNDRPELVDWYKEFSDRQSMKETQPE